MPEDIAEVKLTCNDSKLGIAYLLKEAGLVNSTSEAFRMLDQGAVRIDGERVSDRGLEIAVKTAHVFQVGKRKFAKVLLS
jgi:tyrosyl-tRNA synthetase